MIRKNNLPYSWFTPSAVFDDRGYLDVIRLDEDFDDRYEVGQGILIPVASADGHILSEKKQKAILRHFLAGFSRTRFDLMVGVLRRSPEETVTQILRWCELFKRITGKKHDKEAMNRIGVRAFAVCAPRNVTSPVLQRKTYVGALETGLPIAIYRVSHLTNSEIDEDLIKGLLEKYDNLLLVLDESEPAAAAEAVTEEPAAEPESVAEQETTAFELVGEPQSTAFVLVGSEEEAPEEPAAAFIEAEVREEYKEIARENALVPLSETAETALVAVNEEAEAAPEAVGKKKRLPEEKVKLLRRIIAAELIAAALIGFGIFTTIKVQAAVKRSEALASVSAAEFMGSTPHVLTEGNEAVNKDAEAAVVQARIARIRDDALALKYIEEERSENIEESETYKLVQGAYVWDGPVLTRSAGTVTGPNGRETYYNLNMSGVVSIMRRMGNTDTYWVRSDGCKMLGNYVMVAANLNVHPRGSIVTSSRGLAIVCDTGGFASKNPQQLDVATAW